MLPLRWLPLLWLLGCPAGAPSPAPAPSRADAPLVAGTPPPPDAAAPSEVVRAPAPAESSGAPSLAPRRRIPEALLAVLGHDPYVEQRCEDEPLDERLRATGLVGRRCAYATMGKKGAVVVLNPPGERVARWLVDAASEVPQLVALARADRAAYEEALVSLGLAVVRQSSRIFPLSGDVIEDLGKGPRAYPFDRGVAVPCTRGCHCRINSLSPRAWCQYRGGQGDDERACRAGFEGAEGEERWRQHCFDTHVAALGSTEHPHFRAMLWWMSAFVDEVCPRRSKEPCAGADVQGALEEAQKAWRSGERKPARSRP